MARQMVQRKMNSQRGTISIDSMSDFSFGAAKNKSFPFRPPAAFSLASVSREIPGRDRVRRNYPPSPVSHSSTFLSLSLLSRRYRGVVPNWPRPDSNSLFLARRPIVDKEKRLMKYYATREYMLAHAALPLIRTRENRPFRSQGVRWTASSAMQRYIDSISSFRRADLSPSSAPRHFYFLSLALSLSLPFSVLSLLSASVIPYV